MTHSNDSETPGAILIVDGDILSRHAIADYLRHCGYKVVEAVSTDEAMTALGDPKLAVDVILCDIAAIGSQSGFELANWVRQNRPELEVRIAGSLASAADTAANLLRAGRISPDPMNHKQWLTTSRVCGPRGTETDRCQIFASTSAPNRAGSYHPLLVIPSFSRKLLPPQAPFVIGNLIAEVGGRGGLGR